MNTIKVINEPTHESDKCPPLNNEKEKPNDAMDLELDEKTARLPMKDENSKVEMDQIEEKSEVENRSIIKDILDQVLQEATLKVQKSDKGTPLDNENDKPNDEMDQKLDESGHLSMKDEISKVEMDQIKEKSEVENSSMIKDILDQVFQEVTLKIQDSFKAVKKWKCFKPNKNLPDFSSYNIFNHLENEGEEENEESHLSEKDIVFCDKADTKNKRNIKKKNEEK